MSLIRERTDSDATPDVTVRRLHDGELCAVLALAAGTDTPSPAGDWSRTGPHHVTGLIGSPHILDLLADTIVAVARTTWALPHPSFLRPVETPRPITAGSRAAAMADHPAGGMGRTVRRIVHERLARSVEVDHHQSLELRYPDALVHLQLLEAERSALLRTTIRGVVDPARLDIAATDWAQRRCWSPSTCAGVGRSPG